uniref:Uncharacterized protein n=1 Tax=Stomoxys calcitrans TaxID=35570 RepID=A0A1I8Q8Z6_STOCA
MLQTSSFNLTNYRATIGAPTPEKDLATFIDQMQRVALQIQDVATSSRMTTLGSRSKRLQASILQPLEQLQNEILYHLTALELQRDPWAKQVNQTLNHLRNIQEYLEKTAGEICDNQTRIYTERLKTYLTSSKATMSSQLGDTTAKCRPFFDIFDANRIFFCRNMIDFVNALWFFTFLTLLLWSIATPVGLNLITLQRKITSIKRVRLRAAERGDRSRKRDRGTSSGRDRSSSSTRRSRPVLKRSATEETLDIDDIDREPIRARQSSQSPVRSRSQGRRAESDVEDSWRSPGPSRGGQSRDHSSYERETPRMRPPPMRRQGTEEFDLDNEGPVIQARERSQTRGVSSSRQQQPQQERGQSQPRNKAKPLRRQGTEEFDLDDEGKPERSQSRAPSNSRQMQPQRNQPIYRGQARERDQPQIGKSKPPIARRTPPRTAPPPPPPPSNRSRFSDVRTIRWTANNDDIDIVDCDSPNPMYMMHDLNNTEEFDLDDEGKPERSQSRAPSNSRQMQPQRNQPIYRGQARERDQPQIGKSKPPIARRTPPRTAPPPPPPPSNRSRFSDVRTIRWTANNDDIDIVDCDSPNPMYMMHDLNN